MSKMIKLRSRSHLGTVCRGRRGHGGRGWMPVARRPWRTSEAADYKMTVPTKMNGSTVGMEGTNGPAPAMDSLEEAKAAAMAALLSNVAGSEDVGASDAADEKQVGNGEEVDQSPEGKADGVLAGERQKVSKKKRKKKKRRPKKEGSDDIGWSKGEGGGENEEANVLNGGAGQEEDDVEIVYVPPENIALEGDVAKEDLETFQEVFDKFQIRGSEKGSYAEDAGILTEEKEAVENDDDAKNSGDGKEGAQEGDNDENDDKKLSRRQRKLLERISVAKLKQEAAHAEVVEQWDVTAADPKLLVHLKSYRNSVPVPTHWRQKRKYLQNKRGMHKAPFQLPSFIQDTGIQSMREAYNDTEDSKSLKQRQREKIRPKVGKADIDYQILHNAFFKFQTKPVLTEQGDLYYELREMEVKKKNFKPGVLSESLRSALGMADPDEPPPWLYNMQRCPPPPSYPYLKIPGFNAPIPAGASYGYFPKGWGKPPVDAMNRPLYGDVFGMGWAQDRRDAEIGLPEHEKSLVWGEYGEEEPSSEEEEEEEEEGIEEVKAIDSNLDVAAGIESTTSVLPGGLATPADAIELRKGVQPARQGPLYTVLEEKKANVGSGFFGTNHVYNLSGRRKNHPEGVEVNLNPEDLEQGLGETMLRKKYDEKKAEEEARKKQEDVSDIVAEGLAQKRKELDRDNEKRAKRAKDLKF